MDNSVALKNEDLTFMEEQGTTKREVILTLKSSRKEETLGNYTFEGTDHKEDLYAPHFDKMSKVLQELGNPEEKGINWNLFTFLEPYDTATSSN